MKKVVQHKNGKTDLSFARFLAKAGAVLCMCLVANATQAQEVIKCNDFLNNVGVSGANNWNNFSNADVAFFYGKARDMGARFFRTGEWLGVDPAPYGLKVTFSSGKDKTFRDLTTLQSSVNKAKQYGNSLAVIEGPNEPDPNTDKDEIRAWQEALWNNVKADASLNGVKVSGPAMAHAFGFTKLGTLDQWSDYANCHPYTWPQSELQPRLNEWLSYSEQAHPNQIKMATEMGTPNKISEGGVSPEADAIYITRSYLYLYKLGFRYIANFRFADDDPNFEGGRTWGMIDENLNETPQFTSLKNLLELIDDNSSNFQVQNLNYTLSGNGASDLEQMVMQHSDGRYFLILWQPVDSFDDATGNLTNPGLKNITVNLNQQVAQIRTFKPSDPSNLNNGTNVLKSESNTNTIDVKVNDHILVVEITPNTAPGSFPDPNKWYTIHNRDSELYMHTVDCGETEDTPVDLHSGTGHCSQWRFTNINGTWVITNRRSGQNLRNDGDISQITSDVTVAETTAGNGDRTRFLVVPSPVQGFYNIQHNASGLYLRNNRCNNPGSTAPDVVEFINTDGECAQWKFTEVFDVSSATASTSTMQTQSLQTQEEPVYQVFPNPVNNSFSLKGASEASDLNLKLFDLSGNLVMSTIANTSQSIDVSRLIPGVYLVKVYQDGEEIVQTKLVKK
ncbi:T9SS type A sorting domain-containing protein [Galbibacter mesophilus]|uniref:T9SS type A sorting domain-containing protein n=1 Tax=Galbibacter mesophilus TaxID=379069 RepID=UPI00191E69D9|nr:T9SS type A sorting domain-containing protein [Galbibacter mesophilus]MCM5663885.1 T9SS type A sorting domain-containing protein [Galbibacter mesophilus]